MEPLEPPKTINVYALVQQRGLHFSYSVNVGSPSIGSGFYGTRREAEYFRTLELLKDTNPINACWHVFELTVPNPACQ